MASRSLNQPEDVTCLNLKIAYSHTIEVALRIPYQIMAWIASVQAAGEIVQYALGPLPIRPGHQLEHRAAIAVMAASLVRGAVQIARRIEGQRAVGPQSVGRVAAKCVKHA